MDRRTGLGRFRHRHFNQRCSCLSICGKLHRHKATTGVIIGGRHSVIIADRRIHNILSPGLQIAHRLRRFRLCRKGRRPRQKLRDARCHHGSAVSNIPERGNERLCAVKALLALLQHLIKTDLVRSVILIVFNMDRRAGLGRFRHRHFD